MSIKAWRDVDWPLVSRRVERIQYRIYKASSDGNSDLVHHLQKMLLRSKDAKLLAVRRVTQVNKGRKTAGVDDVRLLNVEEKLRMAQNLKVTGYAHPIRRVWIPKPGKTERRPLGIPTMRDRATQQLVRLALEPEWEARFESNSYGFRPGRSCHDAIQAIFIQLRGRKLMVFDADIRKCFDRIDHKKLLRKLDTFPLLESQISAWLKAGVVEVGFKNQKDGQDITETVVGTPQGGVISPLLANIALHGLEDAVKEYYSSTLYKGSSRAGKRDRLREVAVIRYADDFVVLHKDEQVIYNLKTFISQWLLQNAGLEISEEKSSVVSTSNGFNFLGFHIISLSKGEKTKCKICVSKRSKLRLLTKTRNIIQNNRSASAGALIGLLNPVIIGWCNYYRYAECVKDFKQVEYALFGQIRAWVFRRRSKGLRSRESIKEKYFPSHETATFRGTIHTGSWILIGSVLGRKAQKKKVNLVYPSWIKSEMWVKISGHETPFNGNHFYWAKRNAQYSQFNHQKITLLTRQKFKCPLCGLHFTEGQIVETDHIKPLALGGNDSYQNLQAVHDYCHHVKSSHDMKALRLSKKEKGKGGVK